MPRTHTYRPIALAAALAALAIAPGARAAHLRLFVLTGQSNSLGTTAGGEADPSPGSDPADARIRFFWHNVVDATTSLGDSGNAFTNLCAQQGGYYAGSATHWGPEIAFGRTLYRAGVRDFGIVKASRGGGGNTYWSKADGGHMYTLVTDTVARAAARLAAEGDTCEVAGLLYLQGESDSSAEASIASNRLAALVANLRTDLPGASGLQAVIGGIAAAGATRDTVRAQQAALGAADPAIDTFSTLDLQSQLYDSLHFDKAAKLTVGQRYARAFLDAGVVQRRYGKIAFIGDSITQGGYGHPSYRYEVFKRLATNGATFSFSGSVTGAYAWSAVAVPDWSGNSFTNAHDGHWGWRASWSAGRVPLPSGRYNANNLGNGTLANWTGQSAVFLTADAGTLAYTGASYAPDTAVVLIGINDLGDGVTTNQLLSDVAALVRQAQAANPAVAVTVSSLLHVGSGHAQYPSLNATVDAYNASLARLAPTWSTERSAVFFADATSGFNADAMTYDNVHPNAAGEAFLGGRLAAALGLPEADAGADGLSAKDSADFANRFSGSAIWNGTAWTNGWTEGGAGAESLVNVDDFRFKASGSGEFISGEGEDGIGGLNWSAGYGSNWTVEVRLLLYSATNGVALWAGEGENKPVTVVTVYNDRTTSSAGRFIDYTPNNDGRYHTFRVAYLADANIYHVWRDGVRLTASEGVAADQSSNANGEWFFIGDYTSGTFGDNFDIAVDEVCYDLTGAYAPASVPHTFAPPDLTDVFVGGDGHYAAYRIPALQTTLTGMLLAFAEGRASLADQAQNDIVLKRSRDNGANWETLQLLQDDGTNSLNNPCVLQDALTGRIHLMYQRYPYGLNEGTVLPGYTGDAICRSFVLTSDDDGATWSVPRDITAQVKPPAPADSIASGPGAGLQLRHPGPDGIPGTGDDHAGRLIMPFNHGESGPVWRVFAVFSDDHGATWSYGSDAPDTATSGYGNEVQMVELSDGRLLLNARTQGGLKYRKTATSADGGQTWTPLIYDEELIEPTCCASVVRLTDTRDGQINRILYAGPYSQTSRVNGYVHLSVDDGDTWPIRRQLYSGSFGYNTLTALADGSIGCFFERDNNAKISFSRTSLAWLTDGAETLEGGYPRISVVGGPAGITASSAVLCATLTTTGTASTAVSVYWGTADGGADTSAWLHARALSPSSGALPAGYAVATPNLEPATLYFYRYRASNAHGTVWSDKMAFRTEDGNGITATNGVGATAIGVGEATLNGGADNAGSVIIHFGASDGGTSFSDWETQFRFSLATAGTVSQNVTGLLYGVRYAYRTFATNAVNGDWAEESAFFTTPRFPLTSVQPFSSNYGNYAGQSVVVGDPLSTVVKSPSLASMPQRVALNAFSLWRQAGDNGTVGPLYIHVYRGTAWANDFVSSSTNTVDFRSLSDGQKGTWLFDALQLDRGTEYCLMASTTPVAGSIATVRIRAQGGNPASGSLRDSNGAVLSSGYDARYEVVCELPIRLSNAVATACVQRAATLRGTLTAVASVYQTLVYWGETDGGANPAAWEHSAFVGCLTNAQNVALSYRATGLRAGRAYHFTYRATNAVDSLWAPLPVLFATQVGTRVLIQ